MGDIHKQRVVGANAVESGGDEGTVKVTVFKSSAGSNLPGSAAAAPEDAFSSIYWDGASGKVLKPPYDFAALEDLVETNNAISPCIAAYEINIDGSGYNLQLNGASIEQGEADSTAEEIFDFFNEVSPGKSMTSLRKDLRVTLEKTGNAFVEVIRNIRGDIICLLLLPTNMMRLLRLGPAVSVTRRLKRFGRMQEVNLALRERAYVQVVGLGKFVFFKEFGSSRDINRETGEWSRKKLPYTIAGNEILHFIAQTAANSPYGVPRWINQVPSVVGSRRAEELNLDFFNSGGIPPVLVFITGGSISGIVRKQLESIFNAAPKDTTRGAVVEVQATSGTLDKENKPDVLVEKFGSEAQSDSMFENYDIKCEKRVRRAFRLPPLFVGSSDDYNYASAYASYLVAEAQVFAPERQSFDEIMNMSVMQEFDPNGEYTYKSKQISIKSVEAQLKGLLLLRGVNGVEAPAWINSVNEVCSLKVPFVEGAEPMMPPAVKVASTVNQSEIGRAHV